MSDPGAGASGTQGQGRYQNGVWLSKAEGARSEKYQKWTEERTKSTVESLDKQKHNSLVKLHAERLKIRTELRGLQQDRRHLTRDRHGSLTIEEPDAPVQKPTSVSSSAFPSEASKRRLQKVSSSTSSTSVPSMGHSSAGSASSSSSSSSSPHAFGRSGREETWGGEAGGGGGGGGGGGARGGKGVVVAAGKGVGAKVLSADESAMKLKNIHSSRALSKLKNNMDINN